MHGFGVHGGKTRSFSIFGECSGVPQALFCLETDGTGCVLGLDFDELNRFNFSVKLVQVDFLKALLQVLWQVSMHVSRFNWHIQVVWARHQIWHTLNIL